MCWLCLFCTNCQHKNDSKQPGEGKKNKVSYPENLLTKLCNQISSTGSPWNLKRKMTKHTIYTRFEYHFSTQTWWIPSKYLQFVKMCWYYTFWTHRQKKTAREVRRQTKSKRQDKGMLCSKKKHILWDQVSGVFYSAT